MTNILLNNHKHLFNNFPKLCCTGIVDEYGNIKGIKFAKEKLEAAKQMGFDFIILPEANRKDVKETHNTIFFENIVDLDKWIIEYKNRIKERINHWLSIGGTEPSQKEFNSYFDITLKKDIKYWQNQLKYVPLDEAIKRLKILYQSYKDYLNSSDNSEGNVLLKKVIKLKHFLSTHLYYALIPELINVLKANNFISDYLYSQIIEAIDSQSPDFAIAKKIIRDNKLINNISDNQYLKEKYPQLLCFFFNNPSELIYILASAKNPTTRELKLLRIICNLLNQNKSENEIINTALHNLNPVWNWNFEATSEMIPHSQQLALLDSSINNLKSSSVYKKELKIYTSSIEKYRDKIYKEISDKSKLDKQINNFNTKLERKKNIQNTIKESDKYKEINKYFSSLIEEQEKKILLPLGLNSRIYNFLSSQNYNLVQKLNYEINIDSLLFEKRIITINNYKNSYFNNFYKNLNLGKMGEMITECIAFFYGKYIVRIKNSKDLKLLLQNKYDLPFSIGLMCQKPLKSEGKKEEYFQDQYTVICDMIKDIFNRKKPNLRKLMWLYFLYNNKNIINSKQEKIYESYKNIITTELEKYLLLLSKNIKSNSEFKREFEFITALFGINNEKLGCNSFGEDVHNALIAIKKNSPKTITRTEQLLYPIYLILQVNNCNFTNWFEIMNYGSLLNNANFVVEFMRSFGYDSDLNDLFRPIHGFSDIEKHLFETMTIIRIHQESSHYDQNILKNYILNNICDYANLNFALNILNHEGNLMNPI